MIDAHTPAAPDPDDPLALAELFQGGGEPWLPLLKPVIEAQRDAASFIGPGRGPDVVPVRELTFQALKPHPPHQWKVVVFGQNPYPRPESATGIAMFDNTSTTGRTASSAGSSASAASSRRRRCGSTASPRRRRSPTSARC
ncbi:hypothetical protein ACIBBD_02730 [Streptomyces sp. NPDC051315]|uniref:hypothetical protein n=1 Tax=Streptomyces sp. NPDC051315 TaxID=3365650 RepID=UPI0037B59658